MENKKVLFHKKMITISLLFLLTTAGIYLNTLGKTTNQESKVASWHSEMALQESGETNGENVDVVLEQQKEYVDSYGDYVSGIVNRADQMSSISVFANEDSFSNRNMEKTKAAFEKMIKVSPEIGDFRGLSSVVEFDMAHYVVLLFSVLVVWNFFEDEKKGLKCICYATPDGRGFLCVRRIGTLATGISIFVSLLYGILFAIGWGKYGTWDNLFAPVQSAPEFKDCIFNCSVWEYLLGFVLIKIYMAIGVALFIWMMLSIFRSQVLSAGLLVIVVSMEAVLTIVLSEQSPLVALKYVNVFRVIQPEDLLYSYQNYNLNNRPVNCFRTLLGVAGILGIVSAVICIWIGIHRKPFHNRSRLEMFLIGIGQKLRTGYHVVVARLGAVGLELYKILVVQKGIFFLLIWGYLVFASVDTSPVQYLGNSAFMREIYNEYSGPLDGRLEAYIEEQQEFLEKEDVAYEEAVAAYKSGAITQEEFEGKSGYYSSLLPLRNCVENISNQVEYLKNLEDEKGITGWIVDNRGYKFILTDDGIFTDAGFEPQQKRALFCVVVVIFLFAGIFSYDKSCELDKLIRSTQEGRQSLFFRKMGIILGLTAFVVIGAYGLELYEIERVYSFPGLDAPVQSLFAMKDFPFEISILTFMILLEMIHLVMLFALVMVAVAISMKFGGLKGMIISLFVLCGPEAVKMLGMDWADRISLVQPFIYVEAYHKYGFMHSLAGVIFMLGIGIGAFFYVRKQWCKPYGNRSITGGRV